MFDDFKASGTCTIIPEVYEQLIINLEGGCYYSIRGFAITPALIAIL